MQCGINPQKTPSQRQNQKGALVIVAQTELVTVKNKMELNYSRLNGEYISWSLTNGDGRNSDDLRFGQYLWSKYMMRDFTDVFYVESCEQAYSTLLKDLYKLEIQQENGTTSENSLEN